MWGGADPAVDLRRTGINSSQDGTATITHAGLTDGNEKLIFFIGTDVAGEDSPNTGINNSFGVCHITGNDAGGYTFTQRCLGWCSDHNNTVGSPGAIISTDRVLDVLTETGGQDWGLEVTAFSSSGGTITVTTRDNGAGAGMEVYSLIIDLDDRKAKVLSVDGPTSGATWVVTGLGFIPQVVGLLLTDLTSEDTIATDAEAGVMGISSNAGAGAETCHSWYNEDAALTTNTNNLFRSRAIDLRDHDVSTVLQDHSHLSFDTDGFTTTINTENETVAKKFGLWAIEEAAAVVTTGTAAPTLEDIVMAAVGVMQPSGAAAPEMGTITMTAVALMQPSSIGAPTMEAMAMVASGLQKFLGTGAPTLEAMDIVASGLQKFLGTGAPSLEAIVMAAVALMQPSGVGAMTVQQMDMVSSGVQKFLATGAPSLEDLVMATVGTAGVPPVGTAAPTLEEIVMNAVGVGPAVAGSLWPPMRRRRRPGR